jgi:mRNA-degrading endonuclease toxin of MazEF toxin-antitoxin module
MAGEDGSDDSFDRGHVVWHDGLFRGSGRPWLVLSDDRHPFHGEEYLVAGITTTDRPGAIPIDEDEAWSVGGLPRTSYASPWFLTTLKHPDVERGVGALADDRLESVLDAVASYLE